MKSKSLILIALVLVGSAFADEKSRHETKQVAHNEIKGDEPKHTNTAGAYGGGYGGYGGGGSGGATGGGAGGGSGGGSGGGAGGYSAGFSHGGVYGGGQICKWGCCSESFGYSHTGGGYYGCTCCATAAEAMAYKESQPTKAQTKN